jgi:hypothetical protein
MDLSKVSWPVFPLGTKVPEVNGQLLTYTTEALTDEGLVTTIKILDDKSVAGNTLGRRRLLIKHNLLPLKYAVYFLSDFLKISKCTNRWFIDNKGYTFKYTKTTRARLRCFKIKKVIPGVATGALIEVHGLVERFKVFYVPELSVQYAGVLEWGKARIIYGLYEEPFKDTYRKI